MNDILNLLLELSAQIAGMIWWPLVISLLFMVAVMMTYQTRFLQLRKLLFGFVLIAKSKKVDGPGELSPFQSLMTALAATVGNGNIAGVSTAIVAGGPGAIFWMWVSALLGMSTKYAEALLGRVFRVEENGHFYGGPMYYIAHLKSKLPFSGFLAKWYAFALLLVGTIGSGNMAQSNSIALALKSEFSISYEVSALVLFIAISLILMGGVKRIADVSEKLVPAMILLYLVSGLYIVILNMEQIPRILSWIFESAFNAQAVGGAAMGIGIKEALRYGVSRGVLSNESGTGSCAIPAAAAKGKEAVPQAIIAMMGTFIDTIIVCSMTAFIILSSGEYTGGEALNSVALTKAAFASGMGSSLGSLVVSIASIVFGFSTIIAYAYFAEQGFHYLWPKGNLRYYRALYCLFVAIGALAQGKYLAIVWNASDIANGLMVFPNLLALLFFTKLVKEETSKYFKKLSTGKLKTYFG